MTHRDHSHPDDDHPYPGDAVTLLTPDGQRVTHSDFELDAGAEQLRSLYRDMVLSRRFDREATALQRQGELGIWAPLLGQEAAQVGAGRAMAPQDMAFPSYREHGVAWCRGLDPVQLLGIFRGTDYGAWNPQDAGFALYSIVVGSQCLTATGYALGQRLDGRVGDSETGQATICFFGDGATSQGDVHESFVWAATTDAPVVFFCQNNQWAISEPVSRQSRVPLHRRAYGYGFPGIRVDGNDVLATLAVTRWALDEARTGNGPVLVEALTYRMEAHTTSDDATRYRNADEVEAWRAKDPVARLRTHLLAGDLAGQAFLDGVDADADELATRVREYCRAMPRPGPERIFSNVYAEPTTPLQAQRDECLAYQATLEEVA